MGLWQRLSGKPSGVSTAPTHGSPAGTKLTCLECGRHMTKVGPMYPLDSGEVAEGLGLAEECRECGRAFCDNCYPPRASECLCGRHQDSVRVVDGLTHLGSMVIVTVRYDAR